MTRHSSEEPRRQALRIPSPWIVDQNELYELDPREMEPGDRRWGYFCEDMLQLRDPARDLLLDLSWLPDSAPEGSYQLLLLRGEDWEAPLVEFSTRDKAALVDKIEELLLRPPQ